MPPTPKLTNEELIGAAGKQGCDCVAWSRKRRAGFISRQTFSQN